MSTPPQRSCATGHATPATWLAFLASLWLLNLALTFHNVWPTPWIETRHELSVEVAALLLLLGLYAERRGRPSARATRWLALVLLLACLGRYAEVTAPALYGRRIDLYWDAQHLPNVAAMLIAAAPGWLVAAAIAAAMVTLAGLYWALRLVLAGLWTGLAHAAPRRVATAAGAALVALYAAGQLAGGVPVPVRFSLPVSGTYAEQAARLAVAVLGSDAHDALEREPLPGADLAKLGGADVLLVFVESYGATAYDEPRHRAAIDAVRGALASAIARGGREVVSARVVSPTFGGASWLAHSSLLAGTEIASARAYAALLTSNRETLVRRFAGAGYRTVALMPGLKQAWPEGGFYGFDHVYGEPELGYRGPAFGWWRVPDQYALATLDAFELGPGARAPVFAVFPTISTHMPFRPTPPYQPDWRRVLDARPFDPQTVAASLARTPDWTDLSPAYTDAVAYALTTLAGYAERRPAREQVLIVLGDHQPAASVSGPQASHDVPVHVVASRGELLQGLLDAGFEPGLAPQPQALMPMHALARLLLSSFSEQKAIALR